MAETQVPQPTPEMQQEAQRLNLGGNWWGRIPDILEFLAKVIRDGGVSFQQSPPPK